MPVLHRKGRLTRSHGWSKHLGTVWLFDVTFPPNETTTIHHSYRTTAGGSVDQNAAFSYVTRTGATWGGPIGQATFVMQLPPEVHTTSNSMGKPRLIGVGGPSPRSNCGSSTTIGHRSMTFTSTSTSPPGWRQVSTTLVWHAARWPPQDECPLPSLPATPKQTQMCKNLAYAISGYVFETPNLRDYFYGGEKGWRLAPAPHYEPATEAPQVWVRGLEEFPKYDAATNMATSNRSFIDMLDEKRENIVPPSTAEPPAPPAAMLRRLPTTGSEARASKSQRAEPPPAVAEDHGAQSRASHCSCSVVGRPRRGYAWHILLALVGCGLEGRFRRRSRQSGEQGVHPSATTIESDPNKTLS